MQNVVVTLGMALIFLATTLTLSDRIKLHPTCRIFSRNLPCMALP